MSNPTGLIALALFQATERPPAETAPEMTVGGWVFLISAWAFILVLTLYTFGIILRSKQK
ncbi:MAG TPA: hypothetical protein VK421_18150 [Pyrinomonadaceae bacterium]|nr:hypothetical protein [Pyrinomonadaceae bacterium]